MTGHRNLMHNFFDANVKWERRNGGWINPAVMAALWFAPWVLFAVWEAAR